MCERISCCVPFCGRTRKNTNGFNEWICSGHWKLVPKSKRRRDRILVKAYIKRFGKTAYWEFPAGSERRISSFKHAKICRKSWEACKKSAIEKAVGI